MTASSPSPVVFLPELPDGQLVRELRFFFTEERVASILVPLLTQTGGVSLRLLDWLCVGYAKRHNVVCVALDSSLCNIFHEYKNCLTAYRRVGFDPFRRRARATVTCGGATYDTTLGQCNFLHWAHTRGVLRYATVHADDIEADMMRVSSHNRERRRLIRCQGARPRRVSLTPSTTSTCRIYHAPKRVEFDVIETGWTA